MSELDFARFFEEVYGHAPYGWQSRLAAHVIEDGVWPRRLDLPTSAGKTAVVDIAVFALALRPEVAPRRIVFVVDRRLIVDQVAERAANLKSRLADPRRTDEVTAEIADRLSRLSGGGEPLQVASLRGGVRGASDWAQRPDQPWIIASTVDQVGSRLLFRGYGVSQSMRPIHAGLLANDCLFVLDEVHISRPFAETLEQVRAQRARSANLPSRWSVVEMSATPGVHDSQPFGLEAADTQPTAWATATERQAAVHLARRMDARKEGRLHLGKGKTKPAVEVLVAEIPKLVARMNGAVGVVVNRVDSARAVAEALIAAGESVTLLTGRMRPLDRESVMVDLLPGLAPDRGSAHDEERRVVVATQAIEVGADLSFDAMVTECAPLGPLRQRFGRLDRQGDRSADGRPAPVVIVGVPSAVRAGADPDPIYGEALAGTWHALVDRHGEETFDVGARSPDLEGLGPACEIEPEHAPLLLTSHLDALVQTSGALTAEPDIAPFLHGWQRPDADVRVVWRADIDVGRFTGGSMEDSGVEDQRRAVGELKLCPPRSSEAVAVPVRAARAWLRGVESPSIADVEGGHVPDEGTGRRRPEGENGGRPVAVRWAGDGSTAIRADEVRPGDTIVVPASLGGLTADNWDPAGTDPVTDLGDVAQLRYGVRLTLRLHDDVIQPHLAGARAAPEIDDSDDPTTTDEALASEWLSDMAALIADGCWASSASLLMSAVIERFLGPDGGLERAAVVSRGASDSGGYLVLSSKVIRQGEEEASLMGLMGDYDGSDAANSLTGGGVSLGAHLDGVGSIAAGFAARCDLGAELASDLRLAGRLHDLGKADRRFQLWLYGGNRLAQQGAEVDLAKSVTDPSGSVRPTQAECGYPAGARHELASVALALSDETVLAAAHDPELVIHLVATHHGFSRPMPESIHDPRPVGVTVSHDGVELACASDEALRGDGIDGIERFWRLVARYGWFGLTWLESLFRLADHRRSALEEAQEVESGGTP